MYRYINGINADKCGRKLEEASPENPGKFKVCQMNFPSCMCFYNEAYMTMQTESAIEVAFHALKCGTIKAKLLGI